MILLIIYYHVKTAHHTIGLSGCYGSCVGKQQSTDTEERDVL